MRKYCPALRSSRKRYIKPHAERFQIGTAEDFADEIIISTSNATPIGGGGEINGKGDMGGLWDDEDDNMINPPGVSPSFQSLWDDD